MNILMVSAHFNTVGDTIPIGGVQKHISCITEEFTARGNNVKWCYPSEVPLKIKTFPPDIIIAHDFFAFTQNCPIPQIVVFHGWEGRLPLSPEVVRVRQEIEKKAAASICVGDYIKRWYGQKPDIVIYGGVKERPLKDTPKKNKIACVGRLAPDCSPDIFLQAIAKTKNEFSLTMLGDGPLRKELENLARELNIKVEFKGFVDNVPEQILEADIVFTSGYLSILEAYAGKRAVFSVYNNELKEDYLKLMPCPPYIFNSPEELAKKIDEVCLEGCEEKIEENFKFAVENSWEKLADKYEGIIKKVLNK